MTGLLFYSYYTKKCLLYTPLYMIWRKYNQNSVVYHTLYRDNARESVYKYYEPSYGVESQGTETLHGYSEVHKKIMVCPFSGTPSCFLVMRKERL